MKQIDETIAKLAELDKRNPKPAGDDPERLELIAHRDQLQRRTAARAAAGHGDARRRHAGGSFPNPGCADAYSRQLHAAGPVVARRLPEFFAGESQPAIASGSGRRELANWVASKENPLTARVIVNRVWQWHFGDGLVRTPNNFGLRSEPPSHPELLDWLAARFVGMVGPKKLHRRIMLSAAYQQSSVVSRDQLDQRSRKIAGSGRFSPAGWKPKRSAMPCCRSRAGSIRHGADRPTTI